MNSSELNKYMKDRLNRAKICPICGGIINNDDIIYTKVKENKNIIYNFYHKKCAKGDVLKQIKYYVKNVKGGEIYGDNAKNYFQY